MKIAVLSNHVSGLDTLRRINRTKVPVNLIITTREELNQKRQISGAVPFEEIGLPIYFLDSWNLKSDIERVVAEKIDLLLVMGFQRLVPQEIIDSVKIASFGFHGSSEPLPKGRGRSPINWELIRGKDKFILHMFKLEADADSGLIFDRREFDMNPFDTIETVYYKVSLAMREMAENVVSKMLKGKALASEPQVGEPSYFPKRTPEDGLIQWPITIMEMHNFVRALTRPYPGAFAVLRGEKLSIYCGQPFSNKLEFDQPEGSVIESFFSGDFLIKCSDGAYLVTDFEGPQPKVGDNLRSEQCLSNMNTIEKL